MKTKNQFSAFLALTLYNCVFLIFGCGTHGSIQGYRYCTTKDKLENAVMTVINHNPNILRDTSLDYLGSSPLLDHSGDSSYKYQTGKNFYNDIKHYVTIKIASGQDTYNYTFRYYDSDASWFNSQFSEIFICYARNKNGSGGSEGQHSFRFKKRLKKELTDIFETEFVSKIDKELYLIHTTTK